MAYQPPSNYPYAQQAGGSYSNSQYNSSAHGVHRSPSRSPAPPVGHGFRPVSPVPPVAPTGYNPGSSYPQSYQQNYNNHSPRPSAGPSNMWSQISGQTTPYTQHPTTPVPAQSHGSPDRRHSFNHSVVPSSSFPNQQYHQAYGGQHSSPIAQVQPQYTSQPLQHQYTAQQPGYSQLVDHSYGSQWQSNSPSVASRVVSPPTQSSHSPSNVYTDHNGRPLPAPRARPESMPPPSRFPSTFAAPTAIAPPSRPPLLASTSSSSSVNNSPSSPSVPQLPRSPGQRTLPMSSFPQNHVASSSPGIAHRPPGSSRHIPTSSFPQGLPSSSFPQLAQQNGATGSIVESPQRSESPKRPLPAPSTPSRHAQKSFSVDFSAGMNSRGLPSAAAVRSPSPPKPSASLSSVPESAPPVENGPFVPYWKRNMMTNQSVPAPVTNSPALAHERRGTVSAMVSAYNTDAAPSPESTSLNRSMTTGRRPLPSSPTKAPEMHTRQSQSMINHQQNTNVARGLPSPSPSMGSTVRTPSPKYGILDMPRRNGTSTNAASERTSSPQHGINNMPSQRGIAGSRPSSVQSITMSMAAMSAQDEEEPRPIESPKPSWPVTLPPVSRSSSPTKSSAPRSSSPLKKSTFRRMPQDLDDPPPSAAPAIRRVAVPSKSSPAPAQRALPEPKRQGGARQPIPKISFHENANAYSDSDSDEGPPKINVSAPPPPPQINIMASGPPQISVSAPEPPRISVAGPEPPSISVSSDEPSGGPSFTFTVAGEDNEAPAPLKNKPKQLDPSKRPPAHTMRCGGCGESIIGRIVHAIGYRWHPACFQCCVCGELLEHVSSYEHEGRPYCHLDYHELFAPRCYHCKTPIVDERFVTLDDEALGKRTYHEQHFFCSECGDPFLAPSRPRPAGDRGIDLTISGDGTFEDDDVGFTVYKGYAYCENCHVNLRLPKCKKCKRPIRDGARAVEALGSKWCWECFTCAGCENPFENPSFFEREGYPFCERCFSIIIKNDI